MTAVRKHCAVFVWMHLNLPSRPVWFCVTGVTLGGEAVSGQHPRGCLVFQMYVHTAFSPSLKVVS